MWPRGAVAYRGEGKGKGKGRGKEVSGKGRGEVNYPILKKMRSFAPRGHGWEVAKLMAVPFPQVQGQIAGPR